VIFFWIEKVFRPRRMEERMMVIDDDQEVQFWHGDVSQSQLFYFGRQMGRSVGSSG